MVSPETPSGATPLSELETLIAGRLDDVLVDAHYADVPHFSRGKVRDCYDVDDDRRIIVSTDRQSAFDQVLAAVPFKGRVLTATARFWFDATRDIAPNHVIAHPHPNVLVARRLEMLPVEIVVRDFLTGSTSTSIWPMYQAGEREPYGVRLPDGLTKNAPLPATIITPTTKAGAGDHDRPVSAADVVNSGLISAADWARVSAMALALFARGREIARGRGLILVDTKFEFGRDSDGTLRVADEILTPDSSRYWVAGTYDAHRRAGTEPDALDKDFLRRWVLSRCGNPYEEPIPAMPPATLAAFGARYVRLYEIVTGNAFVPPPAGEPPDEGVRAAIAPYL